MMGNVNIRTVNFLLEKREWGAAITVIKTGLKQRRFRNTAEAFRLLGHAYMQIDQKDRSSDEVSEAKFIEKCRSALFP